MKVINGDFNKSKPVETNLCDKILKAVERLQEDVGKIHKVHLYC